MRQISSLRTLANSLFVLGMLTAGWALLRARRRPITVTNPTFDTTVDATFTDGANTYLGGSLLPTGYYITAGVSQTIFSLSTGNPTTGNATFSGWNVVGDVGRIGILSPVNASGLSGPGPAGFLTAIAGGGFTGAGGFAQDVPGSIPFQPMTKYVLTVSLLDKGLTVTPTIIADLTASGVQVGGTPNLVLPTASTLGSDTVTFTTGAVAPTGVLGILLEGSDPSGNLSQIIFDNVTLTAQAVPEPTSSFLLAMGALICATAGLRRRATPGSVLKAYSAR